MPRQKKIKEGYYTLHIPEGYYNIIAEHVSSDQTYSDKNVWTMKYLFVIHGLVDRLVKTNMEYVKSSMRMEAKRLKCNNGDCCIIYKNLLKLDLIAINRSTYQSAKSSYSYKVTNMMITQHLIYSNEINKSTDLMLAAGFKKKTVQLKDNEKRYRDVLKKITLDSSICEFFPEVPESDVRKKGKEKEKQTNQENTIRNIDIDAIRGTFVPVSSEELRDSWAIRSIQEGDIRVSRPDKDGRIFTTFTNLPKKFRPFLRLNGQPLIEIDIPNSQPLLASVIFREYSKKKYGTIKEDVLDYQQYCEKRTLYELFMNLNGIANERRGEFKKEFFSKLFFSKLIVKDNYIRSQFRSRFPTCYEAIFDLKGGYYYSKEYKEFPVWLQRIEASVIVDTNFELIEQEIDCFNIFDSIYVSSQEHADIAIEMLNQKFKDLGLNPKLQVKPVIK